MKQLRAVILAAGMSRRLGFNKLSLKINGESVIRMATLPFLSAGIEKVCVVTGMQTEEIEKELKGSYVEFVQNRDHILGMATSVVAAIPFMEGAKGVFFHLGDKPFVEKDMVLRMIDTYGENKEKIIVPLFKGMKGHPVLMDVRRYRREIALLTGDQGLRNIIEKNSQDVLFIEGNQGSLFDIDTVEDIVSLEERGYVIEKSQH
ncbi:MAG TPA: nucleotidyltransferase family protein [Syntrophorhabdaceae bacterium]|nr:nucleotidyltransferase family protein [Syntrophorhabdaceae bacterium]